MRWCLKRVIETLRYDGFHILLWRITKVCLSPIGCIGLVYFWRKDLTQPIVEIGAKVPLTIGQATESDVEELAVLAAKGDNPENRIRYKDLSVQEIILQRFRRGCKCFVGKIGDDIVHYNWIFFYWEEAVPGTGCFILLKDDEAFCEDPFTVETWRGMGIHAAVHAQMLHFLKKKGFRKAYSIGGANNKSAQKTLHRHSWKLSGTMLYFAPRGAEKAWIWRINGTLEPLLRNETPRHVA